MSLLANPNIYRDIYTTTGSVLMTTARHTQWMTEYVLEGNQLTNVPVAPTPNND